MEKQMDSLIMKLTEELEKFDWDFEHTDDHRVWLRANKTRKKIEGLVELIGEEGEKLLALYENPETRPEARPKTRPGKLKERFKAPPRLRTNQDKAVLVNDKKEEKMEEKVVREKKMEEVKTMPQKEPEMEKAKQEGGVKEKPMSKQVLRQWRLLEMLIRWGYYVDRKFTVDLDIERINQENLQKQLERAREILKDRPEVIARMEEAMQSGDKERKQKVLGWMYDQKLLIVPQKGINWLGEFRPTVEQLIIIYPERQGVFSAWNVDKVHYSKYRSQCFDFIKGLRGLAARAGFRIATYRTGGTVWTEAIKH